LTLAGGHGFLMRKYGLACDNLLSADVVTADGALLTASRAENSDLFWGLCGGGGNFGVVTSFEYQLHPVGPMLGGLLMYPMSQAREVLQFYDDFSANAPDELGILAALGTLPDGTKALIFVAGYNGPASAGEEVLRPLRSFGRPLADQIGVMPYTGLQSIVENFNPRGMRNYWKAIYMNELSSSAVDTMVQQYADPPHACTHSVIYTLGGAVGRKTSVDETAVAYRDSRHAFIMIGMWSEAGDDERAIGYVRRYWNAMQPFASGGFYPNYDADTGAGQVSSAYGSTRQERLVALKNKYDPQNFFRLNQNIRPEGDRASGNRTAQERMF
jgi:FAD/FMN-containing dehydrogenase